MGPLSGHQGCRGTIRDIRGVLGAGRECRYSGTRRDIGSIREYWELLGGVGSVWSC